MVGEGDPKAEGSQAETESELSQTELIGLLIAQGWLPEDILGHVPADARRQAQVVVAGHLLASAFGVDIRFPSDIVPSPWKNPEVEPMNRITTELLKAFLNTNERRLDLLRLTPTQVGAYAERLAAVYPKIFKGPAADADRGVELIRQYAAGHGPRQISDDEQSVLYGTPPNALAAIRQRVVRTFYDNGFSAHILQAALRAYLLPDQQKIFDVLFRFASTAKEAGRLLIEDSPHWRALGFMRHVLREEPPIDMTQSHIRAYAAQLFAIMPTSLRVSEQVQMYIAGVPDPDIGQHFGVTERAIRMNRTYFYARLRKMIGSSPEILSALLDEVMRSP